MTSLDINFYGTKLTGYTVNLHDSAQTGRKFAVLGVEGKRPDGDIDRLNFYFHSEADLDATIITLRDVLAGLQEVQEKEVLE